MGVAASRENVKNLVKLEGLLTQVVRGLGLEPAAVCAYGCGAFINMGSEAEARRVADFLNRNTPNIRATVQQDDVHDGGGFYADVSFTAG